MSEIESVENFACRLVGGLRNYELIKGNVSERDAAIAAKARREALRDIADKMDALDVYYYIENTDENTMSSFPDIAVSVGDHIRAMIEDSPDEKYVSLRFFRDLTSHQRRQILVEFGALHEDWDERLLEPTERSLLDTLIQKRLCARLLERIDELVKEPGDE